MKYRLASKNNACILEYEAEKLKGIVFLTEPCLENFGVVRWVYTLQDLHKNAQKFGWQVEPYVDFEISFEYFWEKYNYKVDRKRAEDKWKRLKPDEQRKAIEYLPRYFAELRKTGVAQMYAKTYLHNKIWEV